MQNHEKHGLVSTHTHKGITQTKQGGGVGEAEVDGVSVPNLISLQIQTFFLLSSENQGCVHVERSASIHNYGLKSCSIHLQQSCIEIGLHSIAQENAWHTSLHAGNHPFVIRSE